MSTNGLVSMRVLDDKYELLQKLSHFGLISPSCILNNLAQIIKQSHSPDLTYSGFELPSDLIMYGRISLKPQPAHPISAHASKSYRLPRMYAK
jgi:hypothetical protein